MSARAVSFWEVHRYVDNAICDVGEYPMAGTPEWCSLDDADPRKLAAVLDAGQHHALRVEFNQESSAEASKAVAAAADWPAIANEIRQRREFRATRPWAKRSSACADGRPSSAIKSAACCGFACRLGERVAS